MLDRMKKDFIASRINSGEMESSLKNKSQILDLENHKHRKTKEERLHAKAIFYSLMKNIEKAERQTRKNFRALEMHKEQGRVSIEKN